MEEPTYTLADVARIVCPSGAKVEIDRANRQIKHWTTLDLLVPTGVKHTGTGVSRKYSAHEVRKAAILLELNHYHLPVTAIGDFDTAMANYMDSPDWQAAVRGEHPVLLYLFFSEDMTGWQLRREGRKDPAHVLIPHIERDPAFDTVSAIVINITRLFERLRL
jgi:hypothetical protein